MSLDSFVRPRESVQECVVSSNGVAMSQHTLCVLPQKLAVLLACQCSRALSCHTFLLVRWLVCLQSQSNSTAAVQLGQQRLPRSDIWYLQLVCACNGSLPAPSNPPLSPSPSLPSPSPSPSPQPGDQHVQMQLVNCRLSTMLASCSLSCLSERPTFMEWMWSALHGFYLFNFQALCNH